MMTQAERNAAISRKIVAYTTHFTASQKTAKDALKREGFVVTKRSDKRTSNATSG